MSGFFEELKRRKVYRVAVAYVIAAGGIIQMASAVFPAWDLPEWTLRLTIGARSSAGMIRGSRTRCIRQHNALVVIPEGSRKSSGVVVREVVCCSG